MLTARDASDTIASAEHTFAQQLANAPPLGCIVTDLFELPPGEESNGTIFLD